MLVVNDWGQNWPDPCVQMFLDPCWIRVKIVDKTLLFHRSQQMHTYWVVYIYENICLSVCMTGVLLFPIIIMFTSMPKSFLAKSLRCQFLPPSPSSCPPLIAMHYALVHDYYYSLFMCPLLLLCTMLLSIIITMLYALDHGYCSALVHNYCYPQCTSRWLLVCTIHLSMQLSPAAVQSCFYPSPLSQLPLTTNNSVTLEKHKRVVCLITPEVGGGGPAVLATCRADKYI